MHSSSSSSRRQRTNLEDDEGTPQQLTRGSPTGRVTTATTGRQGQSNDGSTPANFADLDQQDPPSIPNRNRRWSLEPVLNPPADGRGDVPSENNGEGASILAADVLLNAAPPPPPPPPPPPQQQLGALLNAAGGQEGAQQQQQQQQQEEVDQSIVVDTYTVGQPLKFDLSSTVVDINDVDGSFAIKLENVRRTQLYANGAILLAINDKPLHEICASMGGISMNQDRHTRRRIIEWESISAVERLLAANIVE